MTQNWSLEKNVALLLAAFRGTTAAREMHRRSIRAPINIRSGLDAIAERWPELRSQNPNAPVFIFSAGWRSGSTFLQRWIMTADDVLIWGEPYRHVDLIHSLAGQLKAFTQDWPQDAFFADSRDGIDDISQVWVANLYPSLQSFMAAHIAYLEKLFLEPARMLGKNRWGFKEVTLGVKHAHYLRWLFPNAKFLFLYRDPYQAYGSYRKWGRWYRTWPDEPVFTATRFGAIWSELATDFVDHHQEVDGLLLQYEELSTQATRSRLQDYLDLELPEAASLTRVGSTGKVNDSTGASSHWIPKLEALLLKRQVEPMSLRLGYRPPGAG